MIEAYERILGFTIDKTDELEDAAALLHFVKQRKLSAIMHGHKHIPRATKVGNDLVVFGCGSTVGKVSTTDGGTYMSLNIVSVNRRSRKLSGRLLAERIPGGGIVEQKRHEIMLRTRT